MFLGDSEQRHKHVISYLIRDRSISTNIKVVGNDEAITDETA